ncbi:MAG TPA: undecaprenyl-diphosphatase UppP [Gemmatimonas sp.]|uniref:undecaprenyl-diphosphatase UppP n=1 Tax=Gemmatimonas sp. TaxID=1962908 RepID=UPI002EDA2918
MTVWQAIVLGIVQGITEPLPVSSSAHLALTPYFLGWSDPGLAFDVALHLGTLLALVWYFRHEWVEMIASAWRIATTRRVESVHDRRVLYLIVATIPGGIGGLLLNDLAETTFRSPAVIATSLIVMGVLLWAVDRWSARARVLEEITLRDAIIVGCAQVLALVPGVSRSGSTMTAGRLLQIDRPSVARFSFLMSMPITAAAVIVKMPDALREHGASLPLLAGVAAAAVSSWLAISVLLRYVARHSFGVFAIYRVLLGIVVFATLASRA